MIRRTLNIGYYQYILDLFSPEIDDMVFIKKKFVMFRIFKFTNNIASDTNIFIIDTDTWEEMSKEIESQGDNYFPITSKIAFPLLNNTVYGYSNSPMEFNSNLTKQSIYKIDDEGNYQFGKDVYPLTDKNGELKDISCNLLKLYHPNNKLKLNGIICIENYINNIHFYYLCKPLQNYNYNSNNEFTVNNHIYSEYIEIYFPNINDLFKIIEDNNYNIYFNENINTVVSYKNEIFLKKLIDNDEEFENYSKFKKINKDGNGNIILRDQYVPLNLLLQPFQIVEDIDPFTKETYNVKVYLKKQISLENNYINSPFNISIFPYSEIDNENHIYNYDENLTPVNTTYSVDYKFSLSTKLGFDSNHKISLLTTFNYPNKNHYLKYNSNNTKIALQHAYKYFYNIDEDNYKYYWVNKLKIDFPNREYELLEEFEKNWNNQEINNNEENYTFKEQYTDDNGELIWETLDMLSDDEKLRRMIKKNWNGIYDELRDWEVEEDFETGMDFIGFRIQIASDPQYKNLIYNQTFSIELSELDDFSFNINNIFDNWVEMPEFIVARTIFIDRIINRIIVSNSVIITKEIFKYIINDKNIYHINLLNYYNKAMKEIEYKNSNANDMFKTYVDSIEEMNTLFFNELNKKIQNFIETNSYIGYDLNNQDFIDFTNNYQDKLKTVNNLFKEQYFSKYIPFNFVNNINCIVSKPQNNLVNINKDIQQKIIYKPIFFKTQDLQNIRLRNGVTQNIGINLVNYLTKVETFKLVIDGIEFIESSRNDIYVIFNINSNLFVSSSGKYNIVTQDDEYISSGNWILY